jgi:hypothetical protein
MGVKLDHIAADRQVQVVIPKKHLPFDLPVGILGCTKGKGEAMSYRIANSSKRFFSFRFFGFGTPLKLVSFNRGYRLSLPETNDFCRFFSRSHRGRPDPRR